MRGIQEKLRIQWNRESLDVESGIPTRDIVESGFHAKVPLKNAEIYKFQFNLVLNGSAFLYFTPNGKITEVTTTSAWEHPKFDGAFLPDERNVGTEGFSSSWKVLHLNRNYPGQAMHISQRMRRSG